MTANITYVDGSHYAADTAFGAERYSTYWTTKIHLTCWSSVLTSDFFDQYPALIPHGGAYERYMGVPESELVCP